MGIYRGFFVLGAGAVLVLVTFLIFVGAGWPGAPNNCIQPTKSSPPQPDSCYCEEFDRGAVKKNDGGVRQPVNTRGLGRWRRHEPHLQPLIEAIVAGGGLAGRVNG